MFNIIINHYRLRLVHLLRLVKVKLSKTNGFPRRVIALLEVYVIINLNFSIVLYEFTNYIYFYNNLILQILGRFYSR